ncbi:Txe/YoeB family addiction module toxin [Mucilaginibacter ginsenosidivorans]|uniref:Putative mRNA interferase YoeB n=1 Tax=Mucilaginibacter ginsenosidivorans TaxID=398053 RepID=A0A5B8V187_9SPHI|nr:Txe/YoeB family addiction module toxin [Mucilaginibacter ginsenosidivorans]QEC64919.1 Txe/YoeB family addiction module toxin [Mucilaginibacter ginsenosidivorans]
MEVIFSPKAIEDLKYWKRSGNKIIQKKITSLIKAIKENPYEGIGKPEPLKHNLSGAWSRRINHEHRLVYEINERNEIVILDILSLKGHY